MYGSTPWTFYLSAFVNTPIAKWNFCRAFFSFFHVSHVCLFVCAQTSLLRSSRSCSWRNFSSVVLSLISWTHCQTWRWKNTSAQPSMSLLIMSQSAEDTSQNRPTQRSSKWWVPKRASSICGQDSYIYLNGIMWLWIWIINVASESQTFDYRHEIWLFATYSGCSFRLEWSVWFACLCAGTLPLKKFGVEIKIFLKDVFMLTNA